MKKLFFLLLVIAFLVGCSDSIDMQENPTINNTSTSQLKAINKYGHILTRTELIDFAKTQATKFSNNPQTRAGIEEKTIKNIIPFTKGGWMKGMTFSNETAKELINNMYIVNYENNKGFAIISADNRIPQTLVYSDYGGIRDSSDTGGGTGGNGSGNSDDSTAIKKAIFEKYMKSLSVYVEELGKYISPEPKFRLDSMDAAGYYYCNPTCYYTPYKETFYKSTPTYTEWNQGYPYNSECPFIEQAGENAVVGCVPLAMAEIMKYHKYPMNIISERSNLNYDLNWESFPSSFTTETEDSKALAALLYRIGLSVRTRYNYPESNTFSSAIPGGFYSFGYTNDSPCDYSDYSVAQSLNNNCPVMVLGICTDKLAGHAWIVDAMKSAEREKLYEYDVYKDGIYVGKWTSIVSGSEESYTNVDCNWGLGGSYNGYYPSGVFTVNGYNFDKVKIITNIKPK